MNEFLFDFHQLSVRRSRRTVLNNIDLKIGLSEHAVILGPNGSGKSSLIKTITRELYPVSGNGSYVKILGQTMWDVFDLRTQLGIVASDVMNSGADISCQEVVLAGFFATSGVWKYNITLEMLDKAARAMRLMGISRLADRPFNQVSAGEEKRVIIARALAHHPQSLLLDEPMANLDMRSAHDLRQALRKVAAAGSQIVMVTQSLYDIIPEIDRVILLQKGRIVMDGRKEEVLTSENLSALFGLKLRVIRQGDYFHLI